MTEQAMQVVADDETPFDWVRGESVVVPQQHGVAVYKNSDGDLVIIGQDGQGPLGDAVVVIPKLFTKQFLQAVREAVKGNGRG